MLSTYGAGVIYLPPILIPPLISIAVCCIEGAGHVIGERLVHRSRHGLYIYVARLDFSDDKTSYLETINQKSLSRVAVD
jgi:hypothetical protein